MKRYRTAKSFFFAELLLLLRIQYWQSFCQGSHCGLPLELCHGTAASVHHTYLRPAGINGTVVLYVHLFASTASSCDVYVVWTTTSSAPEITVVLMAAQCTSVFSAEAFNVSVVCAVIRHSDYGSDMYWAGALAMPVTLVQKTNPKSAAGRDVVDLIRRSPLVSQNPMKSTNLPPWLLRTPWPCFPTTCTRMQVIHLKYNVTFTKRFQNCMQLFTSSILLFYDGNTTPLLTFS